MSQEIARFRKAQALFREGRLEPALTELEGLFGPDADTLRGILRGKLGQWRDSEAELERALRIRPRRGETMYWLAVAKRNLRQFEAGVALCEHALQKEPNPILWNELGLNLLAMFDAGRASKAFGNAVTGNPKNGPFHFNQGLALAKLDRIYQAREAFERSIQLDPKRVEGYLELAGILGTLGEHREAARVLETGSTEVPDDYQLLSALGSARSNEGDRAGAEEIFQRAVKASPLAGCSYGFWLQQEGRFAESAERFVESLRAEPTQGAPYYGLAEAKASDAFIESGLALAESDGLDEKGRVYLCFGLGKALERAGRFEEAIANYHRANEAAFEFYHRGRPIDEMETRRSHEQAVDQYQVEKKAGLSGLSSRQPIFIVGMIRSGTTLLDQILSRHPNIESAGEPVFWMREGDKLRRTPGRHNEEALVELGKRYLKVLEHESGHSDASGGNRHIVDKMPLNFSQLGWIRLAFPEAKIIHLRRRPADTCFSIYTTFLGKGPYFAYHAENIANHYRSYVQLMDRWRTVLHPGAMIEVDYEALIANHEETTRSLIDTLGLPWSDACLELSGTKGGAIRTPSKWQARQPIYGTSVGRMQRFEPWLGSASIFNELETR